MCRDYVDKSKAKILVIGYDPIIIAGDDINEYCFNTSLRNEINNSDSEDKRTVEIADLVYKYISELTDNRYTDEEIYLTNLCRDEIPNNPEGRNIFIKTEKSENALKRIESILEGSNIEYVFIMSLRANYWLQYVDFYSCNKEKEPVGFNAICGKVYKANNINVKVVPVLSEKQYMINNSIKKYYERNYEILKSYFRLLENVI